jgi:selenocysteine-specific elongation factor
VAINLAGVEVSQLRRGMVVAHPDTLLTTTLIDVRFQHLADAELPLKHNAEVKFFVGAAEVLGTARVLGQDSLAPGETGWLQLALAEPVTVVKGDRFILRRPSPGATIGGGVIVDPQAARRQRRARRDPALIAQLETLARGTPGELLLQALAGLGPTPLKDALQKAGLAAGESTTRAVAEAEAAGQLIRLDGEALVASRAAWGKFENQLRGLLGAYHAAHPVRGGMPREELKSRLKFTPKAFNALMNRAAETEVVRLSGTVVSLPDHRIVFSAAQQTQIEALLADFRHDPHNTPSFKDSAARVGDEVLNALIEQETVVQVSADVLFLAETYAAMVEQVSRHLRRTGKITVAEVRDLFATSRKYALALMEHLDAIGVTKRVGDERTLKA